MRNGVTVCELLSAPLPSPLLPSPRDLVSVSTPPARATSISPGPSERLPAPSHRSLVSLQTLRFRFCQDTLIMLSGRFRSGVGILLLFYILIIPRSAPPPIKGARVGGAAGGARDWPSSGHVTATAGGNGSSSVPDVQIPGRSDERHSSPLPFLSGGRRPSPPTGPRRDCTP